MNGSDLFRIRTNIGLSTNEAGQLVHVTGRTWENWESGATKMPLAKSELLLHKVRNKCRERGDGLVVVVRRERDGVQTPIDVVSGSNFCSLKSNGTGSHVISSLAFDFRTKMPCVHRQIFQDDDNEHVLSAAREWRSVLDMD